MSVDLVQFSNFFFYEGSPIVSVKVGSWVARYGLETGTTIGSLGRKTLRFPNKPYSNQQSIRSIKPYDVRYRDQKAIYSE